MNTQYDEINPTNSSCFIGEFRKNQECVDGITFDDLKNIVSQLDLSTLPNHEKYQFKYPGVSANSQQRITRKTTSSNIIIK